MPTSYLTRLENLQKKLRDKCHIQVGHETFFGFYAMISTEGNTYPCWIKFNDKTLRKAVKKLLDFFEGKINDPSLLSREPKDFLE